MKEKCGKKKELEGEVYECEKDPGHSGFHKETRGNDSTYWREDAGDLSVEEEMTMKDYLDKMADVEGLFTEIRKSLKRIRRMADEKKTSIKIGTGTRHETKVYIDPSEPEKARKEVETAVDLMEYGNDRIEQHENGKIEDYGTVEEDG